MNSKHKTEKGKRGGADRETCHSIYRDVMSLRAWSSSSLMALYFSF